MKAVGYSSSSYPANNPIEDRHIIVDEQTSGYFSTAAQPLFHAAVFDGHGGAEVAEMVKTNLVAKVKEVIARIPEKAQKDEAVVGLCVYVYRMVEERRAGGMMREEEICFVPGCSFPS